MTDIAQGTLPLADKGPIAPPPALQGPAQVVSEAVQAWPGVVAATHWNLFRRKDVDGADFYVGKEELGHIHLDGSVHLATSAALGAELIAEGSAQRFPWAKGWVQMRIYTDADAERATRLFRLNYEQLIERSAG